MLSTIDTLKKIYTEHVLLQIKLPLTSQKVELSLNQVDLNQLCLNPVKQWISNEIELPIKSTFPCWLNQGENLEFISKLVNGFVLQVGKTRLVFIPDDAIDLVEFEVAQEWVDLPNWAGHYYIPIRVDLEHQYLHLWGFISHADLKKRAQFDQIFRNYHITQAETISNLDLLHDSYELGGVETSNSAQAKLDPLGQLSTTETKSLIQQLHQHDSRLSPRLELPFTHWGAILNDSYWLERYRNPETDLSMWWESTKLAICDGWELIEHFINPPQAIPVLNAFKRLPNLHTVKGVSLGSERETKAAISKLYHDQTELSIPEEPIEIDHLIPILQNCKIDKIWWRAAEYLWTIQPDHPFLTTRIRQLEAKFAGHSIALMISMIPTLDDRTAVLVRLYSATGTYLPSGLKLTIQDELGTNLLTTPSGNPYTATAREDVQDSYIQLCFAADPGDRFVSCITLDGVEVIKTFKLQQSHSPQTF